MTDKIVSLTDYRTRRISILDELIAKLENPKYQWSPEEKAYLYKITNTIRDYKK